MPKTLNDSYIYNARVDVNTTGITRQILESTRVDKYNNTFKDVEEAVNNRAPYGFFHKLLMDPKVILLLPSRPSPLAFRVIYAKDIKESKPVPKIFIDITDCVNYKNGFYTIRDINIINAYLAQACNHLLYTRFNTRFSSNANLLQNSTKAFVNLFSRILDYLRIPNYMEHKMKVDYLIGLYFIHCVLDRGADTRTAKTLATKISGIGERQLMAADYMYDIDKDFNNIDDFIGCLERNFKLGLTTGVMIDKWLNQYGSGTQYGLEFYPAFASMITNVYCNTYLNQARTIEKVVGRNVLQDLSNDIFIAVKNSLR